MSLLKVLELGSLKQEGIGSTFHVKLPIKK